MMRAIPRACVHIMLMIFILGLCNNAYALDPLGPDEIISALDSLIDNHPAAKRTTVTLKVVDLQTGEVLYDRGGDRLLIPASNLKIYTAAAALDLLGPEYRWQTELIAVGGLHRGVCAGDLLIHGTGDPMMDTEQLSSLADKLVNEQGLKRVKGRVRVVPHPRWENLPLKGTGWMWDDDPDYYNMSIRSTMLNFNVLTVNVFSTDIGPAVTLDPPTQWPPVEASHQWENDGVVTVTRRPFDETILVTGQPKAKSEPVSEKITMHDPSLWIASVFEQMLGERNVDVDHSSRVKPPDPGNIIHIQPIASHTGKPLVEAIRHFLRVSENAVGEMVLLKLAETQTEDDVSWPAGAKVISDWLVETAGLVEGSFRIVDGSGLSRYNLISADSSVKLLAFMKTHEHFDAFYDGLNGYEVAFPEGEKWEGVPLKEFDDERVHAKSGGMSGVATLSGYVQTLDGRWLAFSFLANGYTGSNEPVFDLRNAVWPVLVRYRPAEVEAAKPAYR